MLENNYPLNFIFENINNRLKKIIMASNRKSVINNNRVEAVQFLWFTVPFVRDYWEVDWIASVWEFHFIALISCENSLECIRTLYRVTRSWMLFISPRVRVTMQVMWNRRIDSWNQESRSIRTISDGIPLLVMSKITEHRLQKTMISIRITILDEEPHYRKRFISEMILIKRRMDLQMEGLPKALDHRQAIKVWVVV